MMQNYKEILNTNERLSMIEPRVSKTLTYPEDEMFILQETGARVSIDGSLDLLNVIIQKLSSSRRDVLLTERFEEERNVTMHYK